MELEQVSSALDLLVGYNVNLYVGDEAFKGKLIGVETDHVILENENNYIFYYSLDQIQAITKNTKQFQGEEITSEFLQTQSLIDLLKSLKNSWVTILCLNKQKFNGVLSGVDKHFATLISGEEKVLIKLSHISNILKGHIKDDNNSNEEENIDKNEEAKQENHNETRVKKEKEQPVVQEIETEKVEIPVRFTDDSEKETKVWSQPINNAVERSNDGTTRKSNSEIRKAKGETTQNKKKETKNTVVNETKHVRQKVEKQAVQKTSGEEKVTKEVKGTKNEETANKVKDVYSPMLSIQPSFSKKEVPQGKSEELKQKEEVKQKEQPIRSFRFLGEPVTLREIDHRPSIFEGWPNSSNKPRF